MDDFHRTYGSSEIRDEVLQLMAMWLDGGIGTGMRYDSMSSYRKDSVMNIYSNNFGKI